jgi:hypothetical protein
MYVDNDSVWTRNVVIVGVKTRTQIDDVWEQGSEKNI